MISGFGNLLNGDLSRIGKKTLCVVTLIVALCIIREDVVIVDNSIDDEGGNDKNVESVLAVWMAFQRHPPSVRIFRGLLELNLLLWGGVFSLYMWCKYLGKETIQELLFEKPEIKLFGNTGGGTNHRHHGHSHLDYNDNDNNSQLEDGSSAIEIIFDDETDTEFSLVHSEVIFNNNNSNQKNQNSNANIDQEDSTTENAEDNIYGQNSCPPSWKGTDTPEKREQRRKYYDKKKQKRMEKQQQQKILTEEQALDACYASDGSLQQEEEQQKLSETESSSSVPPSVGSAASMALDMLLAILLALFFFTFSSAEAARAAASTSSLDDAIIVDEEFTQTTTPTKRTTTNVTQIFAQIAAPIFPLLLVWYMLFSIIVPWKKRQDCWTILSYTMGAPLYPVSFRDGFVGDVLTSSVRPMQDIAFTLCYVLSGLQGWWSQTYFNSFLSKDKHEYGAVTIDHHNTYNSTTISSNVTDTAPGDNTIGTLMHSVLSTSIPEHNTIETSWLLHTFLLPMCMVSPLWWRFLQNLKQCYDNKKRWPYLGNAAKYFIAAEVAMFGLFDPSRKETALWILCFVGATLYQVYWDVMMDWEMLDISTTTTATNCDVDNNNNSNSDNNATEKIQLQFQLRSNRLYPNKCMYWTIFVINFILRFCWTLSFLPTVYLTKTGVVSESFRSSLANNILNPALASAEIVRRTLWGLLRVELEAIKVKKEKQQQQQIKDSYNDIRNNNEGDGGAMIMLEELELQPMGVHRSSSTGGAHDVGGNTYFGRGMIPHRNSGFIISTNDMATLTDLQILMELCLYATAFFSLGIFAAYHRVTL